MYLSVSLSGMTIFKVLLFAHISGVPKQMAYVFYSNMDTKNNDNYCQHSSILTDTDFEWVWSGAKQSFSQQVKIQCRQL